MTYIAKHQIDGGRHFLPSSKSFQLCQPYFVVGIKVRGITGWVNKLLVSYLKNWFQTVIIDNKPRQYFSSWEPDSGGLPQGSILLPLLLFNCTLMISHSQFRIHLIQSFSWWRKYDHHRFWSPWVFIYSK